jgi:hypothetical protein
VFFPDPIFEQSQVASNVARNKKFKNLKENLNDVDPQRLIAFTQKYPNAPQSLLIGFTQVGADPNSAAVEEVVDRYSISQSEQAAKQWELASSDGQGNPLMPEHQDMTLNLAKALKGDAQLGVWALLGFESMGEKVIKINRQLKYVADLHAYDSMLESGMLPTEAQENLAMYVSNTQVPDIGKDKGTWGELKEYTKMWGEANKLAGETAFSAAFREAWNGNPVNFDRDRKFIFESLLAEDDIRYQRLLDMGLSKTEARKLYYDNVGTPIKANEALGMQEYTSLSSPNRIQFFEGRKSNYAPGNNINDMFSISNWWRQKQGLDTGVLQPYSPGRQVAYNVTPSGTTAANTLSGIIDGGIRLLADIPLSKGISTINKLKQAPITVDKLLDSQKAAKVDNYLNTFNKNINELEDYVDPFSNKKPLISGKNGQLIRKFKGDEGREYAAGRKLYKQAGVISGTRKSLFRNTTQDLMNSPFGRKITKALTEENNVAKLMTTPGLHNLDYTINKQIADATDYLEVRQILDNLFDTGVINQLPGKQSGLTNAVLRTSALKGKELLDSTNPIKQTIGKGLSAIGKEDAAFLSASSGIVSAGKKTANVIGRNLYGRQAKSPDAFSELMGFSANIRSGYKPYLNKILSVTPDEGLSFTNRDSAVRNLVSHMQVTGYSYDAMKPIVDELIAIPEGNFEAIQNFAYQQILRDEFIMQQTGENFATQRIAKKIFESNADIRKYFVDSLTGDNMPFVGDVMETIVQRGPNGEEINMVVPSLHLLAESSELMAPLVDYRLINRALGKVFTTYGNDFESGLLSNLTHTGKNMLKAFKGGEDFTGIIPSKNLTDDAYTLTLDYMTRNVFKPLVLLRGAWFVRVFMEESMRMAAAGLDNMFIHPASHMVWARSHGQAGRLSKKFLGENAGGIDSAKIRETLEYKEVTNSVWSAGALKGRPTRGSSMGRDFIEVRPGERGYDKAIGTELIQLRNDPIARYLAANGFNDASKAWFRSAEALPLRKELARLGGNKMEGIVTNARDADAYLASVEARIRIKTGEQLVEGTNYIAGDKYSYKFGTYGGNQNLRNAIATGKLELPRGKKVGKANVIDFLPDVSKEYTKTQLNKIYEGLSYYIDEGVNFGLVKGSRPQTNVTGFLGKLENKLDTYTDIAFKHLMTKPNAYLSRSVVWKQYRWQWVNDNFMDMSPKLQKKFIKEAQEAKIPKKVIDEMRGQKGVATGKIDDYDLANVQSRAYGLSATKELLYDASKKHLLSDITRNIFPFPEVWFELAQTWSKILIANPYRARQAQLFSTGAKGSNTNEYTGEGFFAPDPNGSGSEMFVYPGMDFLSNAIFGKDSGVKVAPQGFVSGINLLGQGFVPGPLPYFGVLADTVLPRHGIGKEVRGLLYGEFGPPSLGDVVPFPAWLEKILTAVGAGDDRQQLRASTTIDVYRYGKAVGRDKSLAEQGKLDKYLNKGMSLDDAFMAYSKRQAAQLYTFRGLSQFFLPTGWTPRYYIEDKNGQYWGAQILANEYRELVDKNDSDEIAGANEFLRTYGMEHGWLTAPKTQSKVGKQSFTDRVLEFQNKNKELLETLGLSKWYVLPDSPYDERNYANMYESFNKGNRVTLSPEEYQRQVNDTRGYFQYTGFKEQVEAMDLSNADEIQVLRVYRNYLIEQLPGFMSDYGSINPVKAKDVLKEMQAKWTTNELVLKLESGKAFAEFNPIWEEAGKISESYGFSDSWWLTSSAPEAKALRMGVAQIARSITKEYPDFKYIWIGVYSRLFRDDTELIGIFNDS